MDDESQPQNDPEFDAMVNVHAALKPLDEDSRRRVLEYVSNRLGITPVSRSRRSPDSDLEAASPPIRRTAEPDAGGAEGLEGLSGVALKWMRRSNLDSAALSKIFSLGLDEIDLVASKVPGENKRERAKNVVRLKAMAQYLATGVARVSQEEIKEACIHYDAYDMSNHANTMKGMSRELSGSKENGYTLSASGMTEATKLIQEMTGSPKASN